MLMITAEKLKVPIRARVGKVNTFYLFHEKPIIYFTGLRYDWCQCELTQGLIDDFIAIFGSEDMEDWAGKEVEIYVRDGKIRARLI
jgi:hypothetical protein